MKKFSLLPNWLKKTNIKKISSSRNQMGDRYFSNTLPDFVEESVVDEEKDEGERVLQLLRLPYASVADKFLEAANSQKDKACSSSAFSIVNYLLHDINILEILGSLSLDNS
jgi:hypothetical protein